MTKIQNFVLLRLAVPKYQLSGLQLLTGFQASNFQSPLMQHTAQIIFVMIHAQVTAIDASLLLPPNPVEIYWNALAVEIIPAVRTSGKYKKVDLQTKMALLGLVKKGSSIISAARSLKINYSTAKSIFQNIKAKAAGKMKRKRFVDTDSEPTSEPLKIEHYQST